MRLTKQSIASLRLPAGKSEFVAWDDEVRGFGVRLREGRQTTFFAQFRVNGQTRKKNLGYVGTVTLEKARETARDLLHDARRGRDPRAAKAEARAQAALTLGKVAEKYLKHAETRLKPRSYLEVERHLTKHWAPLRNRSAHSITRADVAVRLAELARENGPIASNRARAALSAMFAWAMGTGLAESNPTIGTIKAAGEVSRDHVISDEELVAIWNACRDDDYGRIVRLLILTAQRREEVGAMAWSELDLRDRPNCLWTIPRSRAKNSLEHEVPLPPLALDLIQASPRRDGRDLVFGEGDGGFSGWSKAKIKLDERIVEAGVKIRPWRLHDLRRTAATRMADNLRVLPHVVETILNHSSGHKAGVAGIYNKATYRGEKRQALELWAAHIEALVSGKQSNIVPLTSGARM